MKTTFFTIWLGSQGSLFEPHLDAIIANAQKFDQTLIIDDDFETYLKDHGQYEKLVQGRVKILKDSYVFDVLAEQGSTQIDVDKIKNLYEKTKPLNLSFTSDILRGAAMLAIDSDLLIYHDADLRFDNQRSEITVDPSLLEGSPLKFGVIGPKRTSTDKNEYALRSFNRVKKDIARYRLDFCFNSDLIFFHKKTKDGNRNDNFIFNILEQQEIFLEKIFSDDLYFEGKDGKRITVPELFKSKDLKAKFKLTEDQVSLIFPEQKKRIDIGVKITDYTLEHIKQGIIAQNIFYPIDKYLEPRAKLFYEPILHDDRSETPELDDNGETITYHYSHAEAIIQLRWIELSGTTRGMINFFKDTVLEPSKVGVVSRQNNGAWLDKVAGYVDTLNSDTDTDTDISSDTDIDISSDTDSNRDSDLPIQVEDFELCLGERNKRSIRSCVTGSDLDDSNNYRLNDQNIILFKDKFPMRVEYVTDNEGSKSLYYLEEEMPNNIKQEQSSFLFSGKVIKKIQIHFKKNSNAQEKLNELEAKRERILFSDAINELANLSSEENKHIDTLLLDAIEKIETKYGDKEKLKVLHRKLDKIGKKHAEGILKKIDLDFTSLKRRAVKKKLGKIFSMTIFYDMFDSMSGLRGNVNSLSILFNANDLMSTSSEYFSRFFSLSHRTKGLRSFLIKLARNPLSNAFSKVATIYYFSVTLQSVVQNKGINSLMEGYLLARTAQGVIALFSKLAARLSGPFMLADLTIVLREQLIASREKLHELSRSMPLNSEDSLSILGRTFLGMEVTEFDRIRAHKMNQNALKEILFNILHQNPNIRDIVFYPQGINVRQIYKSMRWIEQSGGFGGLVSCNQKLDKECYPNQDESEECYPKHSPKKESDLDNAQETNLTDFQLIPLPVKLDYMGNKLLSEGCLNNAKESCEIDQRGIGYARNYARLQQINHGDKEVYKCILLDSGKEPDGHPCKQASDLEEDIRRRTILIADGEDIDPRALFHLTEKEYYEEGFRIISVPRGTLIPYGDKDCLIVMPFEQWNPAPNICKSNQITKICDRTHFIGKPGEKSAPIIVGKSKNNRNAGVLYPNYAIENGIGKLQAISRYPANIVVSEGVPVDLKGSDLYPNYFIVLGSVSGVLTGGDESDIVHLPKDSIKSGVVSVNFTNGIIDFGDGKKLSIVNIEGIESNLESNSSIIVERNCQTKYVRVGPNGKVKFNEKKTCKEEEVVTVSIEENSEQIIDFRQSTIYQIEGNEKTAYFHVDPPPEANRNFVLIKLPFNMNQINFSLESDDIYNLHHKERNNLTITVENDNGNIRYQTEDPCGFLIRKKDFNELIADIQKNGTDPVNNNNYWQMDVSCEMESTKSEAKLMKKYLLSQLPIATLGISQAKQNQLIMTSPYKDNKAAIIDLNLFNHFEIFARSESVTLKVQRAIKERAVFSTIEIKGSKTNNRITVDLKNLPIYKANKFKEEDHGPNNNTSSFSFKYYPRKPELVINFPHDITRFEFYDKEFYLFEPVFKEFQIDEDLSQVQRVPLDLTKEHNEVHVNYDPRKKPILKIPLEQNSVVYQASQVRYSMTERKMMHALEFFLQNNKTVTVWIHNERVNDGPPKVIFSNLTNERPRTFYYSPSPINMEARQLPKVKPFPKKEEKIKRVVRNINNTGTHLSGLLPEIVNNARQITNRVVGWFKEKAMATANKLVGTNIKNERNIESPIFYPELKRETREKTVNPNINCQSGWIDGNPVAHCMTEKGHRVDIFPHHPSSTTEIQTGNNIPSLLKGDQYKRSNCREVNGYAYCQGKETTMRVHRQEPPSYVSYDFCGTAALALVLYNQFFKEKEKEKRVTNSEPTSDELERLRTCKKQIQDLLTLLSKDKEKNSEKHLGCEFILNESTRRVEELTHHFSSNELVRLEQTLEIYKNEDSEDALLEEYEEENSSNFFPDTYLPLSSMKRASYINNNLDLNIFNQQVSCKNSKQRLNF